MKKPEVDLSECSICEICVDLCPIAFQISDAGYVEVMPLDEYPVKEIDEVIKNCRGDCISWNESG